MAGVIRQATIHGLDVGRVLLVRAHGDEASLALAVSQSLTIATDFFSSLWAKLFTPLVWLHRIVIVSILGVLGTAALANQEKAPPVVSAARSPRCSSRRAHCDLTLSDRFPLQLQGGRSEHHTPHYPNRNPPRELVPQLDRLLNVSRGD